MDAEDDLGVLEIPAVSVTAGGEEFIVKPMAARQLPQFIGFMRDIQPTITEHGLSAMSLIEHENERVGTLAASVVGKAPEWALDLDADEYLELVGAVVEMNADFFVQRLLPAMAKTQQALLTILSGTTSFSDSSAPDIDTATS